jgi:hypothetical protein
MRAAPQPPSRSKWQAPDALRIVGQQPATSDAGPQRLVRGGAASSVPSIRPNVISCVVTSSSSQATLASRGGWLVAPRHRSPPSPHKLQHRLAPSQQPARPAAAKQLRHTMWKERERDVRPRLVHATAGWSQDRTSWGAPRYYASRPRTLEGGQLIRIHTQPRSPPSPNINITSPSTPAAATQRPASATATRTCRPPPVRPASAPPATVLAAERGTTWLGSPELSSSACAGAEPATGSSGPGPCEAMMTVRAVLAPRESPRRDHGAHHGASAMGPAEAAAHEGTKRALFEQGGVTPPPPPTTSPR